MHTNPHPCEASVLVGKYYIHTRMGGIIKIGSGLSSRSQIIEQTPSSLVMLFVPSKCVNISLQADALH